jgi:hypothetical protein
MLDTNQCGDTCSSYKLQHSLLVRKVFSTTPSLFLKKTNLPFKGFGENVCNLLICGDILELDCSLLDPISDEVIFDLNMLGPVMEYWILIEFDTTLIIIVYHVGSNS